MALEHKSFMFKLSKGFCFLNFLCWLEVSRCRKPQKCVDIFLDLWADFPMLSTFELSKLRSGRSKCQPSNRFVHSFASFNFLINFHSAGSAGCVKSFLENFMSVLVFRNIKDFPTFKLPICNQFLKALADCKLFYQVSQCIKHRTCYTFWFCEQNLNCLSKLNSLNEDPELRTLKFLTGSFILFLFSKIWQSSWQRRKGRICYSFFETFMEVVFIRYIQDYQVNSLHLNFQSVNSFFSVPCWFQVLFSNLKAPKTSKALQFLIFVNRTSSVKYCRTLFIKICGRSKCHNFMRFVRFFLPLSKIPNHYSRFRKGRRGYSFFETFIGGLIIRDIRDYQAKALCLNFHKVIGVFFRNLAICNLFYQFHNAQKAEFVRISQKVF